MTSLNSAGDALDNGARTLSGEQVAPEPMGLGPVDGGLPGELPPADVSDLDTGDGFDAAEPAVGGDEELGRKRR